MENNKKDRKYNVGTLLGTKSSLGMLSLENDEDKEVEEEVATNVNGNKIVLPKLTGKNKTDTKLSVIVYEEVNIFSCIL